MRNSTLELGLHALAQVLPIAKTDSIAAMLPVSEFKEDDFLVMLTEKGQIKKTSLSQFANVMSRGIIAIKLKVHPCPAAVVAREAGRYYAAEAVLCVSL